MLLAQHLDAMGIRHVLDEQVLVVAKVDSFRSEGKGHRRSDPSGDLHLAGRMNDCVVSAGSWMMPLGAVRRGPRWPRIEDAQGSFASWGDVRLVDRRSRSEWHVTGHPVRDAEKRGQQQPRPSPRRGTCSAQEQPIASWLRPLGEERHDPLGARRWDVPVRTSGRIDGHRIHVDVPGEERRRIGRGHGSPGLRQLGPPRTAGSRVPASRPPASVRSSARRASQISRSASLPAVSRATNPPGSAPELAAGVVRRGCGGVGCPDRYGERRAELSPVRNWIQNSPSPVRTPASPTQGQRALHRPACAGHVPNGELAWATV